MNQTVEQPDRGTGPEDFAMRLQTQFGDRLAACKVDFAEITLEVDAANLLSVCQELFDDESLQFRQLTDLCGVDYLTYGSGEWDVSSVSSTGFGRGVDRDAIHSTHTGPRFAVVYQLLSIVLNRRLRLRVFLSDDAGQPMIDSVEGIWPSANWAEREAFDLYGILFKGNSDLRRILTDYGFIGHPFRKDFPLSGHVELRYDPDQQRVIYEPVTIMPRTLVPRVVREEEADNA